MPNMTNKEKEAWFELMDAVKGWWNAEPNGVPEKAHKERLFKAMQILNDIAEAK